MYIVYVLLTQKLKQIEQLKQQQAEGKVLESNQVCTQVYITIGPLQ